MPILKRNAASGVDGMRWGEYESGLEDRIKDLLAALEDKIVGQAMVTILNQIYEVDFRGFS